MSINCWLISMWFASSCPSSYLCMSVSSPPSLLILETKKLKISYPSVLERAGYTYDEERGLKAGIVCGSPLVLLPPFPLGVHRLPMFHLHLHILPITQVPLVFLWFFTNFSYSSQFLLLPNLFLHQFLQLLRLFASSGGLYLFHLLEAQSHLHCVVMPFAQSHLRTFSFRRLHIPVHTSIWILLRGFWYWILRICSNDYLGSKP